MQVIITLIFLTGWLVAAYHAWFLREILV